MNAGHTHIGGGRAAVLLLAVLLAGCGRPKPLLLGPNLLPRIVLTSAPAAGSQLGNYSYELSWAGYDADGFIEYFRYAVDPPSASGADTAWVRTTSSRRMFVFSADSVGVGVPVVGGRLHAVAVQAVDDRGGVSPPAVVSFNARTIAPSVTFITPAPSKLLGASIGPSARILWQGTDPDGIATRAPVTYKWALFGPSSDPEQVSISLDPDTLARRFGPTFATWDSLPGTETGLTLRDLQPGAAYILAIVGFDEAGAYSRPFSFDSNLLRLSVTSAQAAGPVLRVRSPFFDFAYPTGGFYSQPRDYVPAQVPANHAFTVDWLGTAAPGAFVTGYRWALDVTSLDDETPREDEATDLRHWSRWGLDLQARLPALRIPQDGPVHHFLLEARDNTGAVSLLVVECTLLDAALDRPLLIVDDTRLLRDTRLPSGCVAAPRGAWPTAAELDTFLFATGGVPWRCYPAGTQSTPGILKGYDADSLVTLGRVMSTIPLSRLVRYRHIVWMVQGGFQLSTNPDDLYPMLRQFAAPGVMNPLAIWLGLGGQLWLMGGGTATATQLDYEVPKSVANVFSSANGELGPGRMMYNAAHWRSEITTNRIARALRSGRAVGGWPGAPDYSLLPEELVEKSPTLDPVAPNRTNASDFYRSNFIGEYLTRPNDIRELDPTDPAFQRSVSMLDTLYETEGGAGGSGWPMMTVYHGSETAPVVFSGFPVWYFTREHAIAVTDFVLQRIWNVPRRPVPR